MRRLGSDRNDQGRRVLGGPARMGALLLALGLLLAACGSSETASDSATPVEAGDDEPAATETSAPEGEGTSAADLDYTVTIAGGGTGSAIYLLGGHFAEWINQDESLGGLDATAQSTGGGVENTRLVENGETSFGLVPTSSIYAGMNGLSPFETEEAYSNIRALFPIAASTFHMLTYDESIKTVSDLAGKRMNTGGPGSASATGGDALVAAADMEGEITLEYQEWDEGTRMLIDGLVDAIAVLGPAPYPSVTEAVATPGRNPQIIELDPGLLDKVFELTPQFVPLTVPANAYEEGLPPNDVETFGHVLFLVAHADVPEDVVYHALSSILSDEGQEALLNAYANFAAGQAIMPGFDAVEGTGFQLHPGATRYFEEQGFDVPDSIRG